jgi:hypothetical protein
MIYGENVLGGEDQQERLGSMNRDYIAGFVDGEGSFHVAFQKRSDLRFGWQAVPEFHISQNNTGRNVLEKIRKVFKCGYVKRNDAAGKRDKTYVLVIRDRKDLLQKVIPFFERYHLHTQKKQDFSVFRKILKMLSEKEHYEIDGFRKIVNLAYSMNANGRYRKRQKTDILSNLSSSETIR